MRLNPPRHCHLPASCHLEGEDRARSSHMSFTPVGVHHAAQHQLYQICAKIKETPAETFCMFVVFVCMLKKAYGDESMSQTCIFESHEKFHEGQEHVQDDERLGHPSTSHTDAMLKISRWLSIGAIAGEVVIDKMVVRTGYQADDRSSPHHAHFSPLHRCDSLRDDRSARHHPGRSPSPRETLYHSKTWVCDPGTFSYASFNIQNVFAGVFFLFIFEVSLHDQLRRGKMTHTNCAPCPHPPGGRRQMTMPRQIQTHSPLQPPVTKTGGKCIVTAKVV